MELSDRQVQVWRALRANAQPNYPLHDWYLGALAALASTEDLNPDRLAQAGNSLRELLEKLPRALGTEVLGPDTNVLKQKRESAGAALIRVKGQFPNGWIDQTITIELSSALEKFEEYVELSNRPSRRERTFAGLKKLDPMIQALPQALQQGKWQRYNSVSKQLEDFTHHRGSGTDDDFRNCLTQMEDLVLDFMAPITADDQNQLLQIISKGASVSDDAIKTVLRLIERRGANCAFFFQNVQDRAWIRPLQLAGYFKTPSPVEPAGEGLVAFPVWWPMAFLKRIVTDAPDEVLRILLTMDRTNNPQVLDGVVEIASQLPIELAVRLEPMITDYINKPSMFDENIVKLLNKWAASGPTGLHPALRICRELVFFKPDPREKEKKAKRKEGSYDWSTSLEPSPRFQDWEYAEFLDRGVRPLAVSAPLATAKLLIEAVANMLALDTGREPDDVEGQKNDVSEIWSPRVDEKRQPYSESKADLVRTLTFACEQVYETHDQEQVKQLDTALREGKWYVFDRIRYHLYAKFPARTKDWIRESISVHQGYAAEQYGFEFQRMIRIAIEQLGPSLLTKDELTPILETIVNAPDKEQYKEFMAEQFSEEGYQRRQEYFQRRQLSPFAPVLFGKYEERYRILVSAIPTLTDDDFVRFGTGESKTGASRSPKGVAELALLTDDELVSFLNSWEDAHRDSKEWWVDIDFTGLATAFQQVILANPHRFLNWGERWRTLERPIYLRYALDAGAKRIAGHRPELSQWLDIADWIMTRMENRLAANEKTSETSRNHPDWAGARRHVVDFIAECIKKDVDVDLEWRPRIFQLLKLASVAPDYYLDADKPIVTPRDYLTDAINTMRGRAIENLLQYGFWVKRHQEDADLSDVFDVLRLRFAGSPPLALAEYALLGASFYQLHGLNVGWTKENVSQVFPQSKTDAWTVGFGAYLRWNSAHPLVFDILNPHLDFAVEHLSLFKEEKNPRNDSIAHLGQHLLDYYILGFVDLDKSPLARFYANTEPKYWSALFDHLGRMLSKATELKPELAERCKAFFEARLAAENVEELREFTFWLKAECLEPKWRLTALSRILDVTKGMNRTVSMLVEDLAKLAGVEPDLAVECFAKLTQGLIGQSYFYLRPEQVKPILKIGLASKHEKTVDAATFALDNLLKAGRSEYRNLDAIKDDGKWN